MKKTCFNVKKDTLQINLELRSIIPVIIFHSIIFTLQIYIVHNHTHFQIHLYTRYKIISRYIFQIFISVDIGCPPLIGTASFQNKLIGRTT